MIACRVANGQCSRCGAPIPGGLPSGAKFYRECSTGLGDRVASLIDTATLGHGKQIAQAVAHAVGASDCGCDQRQQRLNEWGERAAVTIRKFRIVRQREPSDNLKASAQPTTKSNCQPCGHRQSAAWPRCEIDPSQPAAIHFDFRHGLGDAVQFAVVLRHLAKYRPLWQCTVEQAAEFCGLGFQAGPLPGAVRVDMPWHEPTTSYADSPATKAEHCLREMFGIQPDPDQWWYHVEPCGYTPPRDDRPVVLMHYQGHSFTHHKNLGEQTTRAVAAAVHEAGGVLWLLDNCGQSALRGMPSVVPVEAWGPAAIAALASAADLCIGIDSGRGHVFGAVDTDTLIVWPSPTLHPLHYFAPADNVTHLVYGDHEAGIRNPSVGLPFFLENYQHQVVDGWLGDVLPYITADRLAKSPVRGC